MKTWSGNSWIACGLVGAALISGDAAAVTLRVASASPSLSFTNEPFNTLPTAISQAPAAIFDPLLRLGPDGQMEAVLAESWTATSPTTWEFKLRKGVVFSNGEPFDAAAVKYTIEWLKSPAARTQLIASEVRVVERIDVVDPHTVVFTTAKPDAVLPKRLSIVYMVPPTAFAELGVENFRRAPIGTGPYAIKEWGQERGRMILEANPTAWLKPRQIDRVEVFSLIDPITRVQALTSNQVDIAYAVNHDDLDHLREIGFNISVKQESQVMALALRSDGPPGAALTDVRVRQALNYAVDKEGIAKVFYNGLAQAVGQGAIAGTFGYNPDIKPYPYDPAKAKSLLAEAGFANGLKLKARIVTGQYVGDAAVYQKMAADLAAVGVQVELNGILPQEWMQIYTVGDWHETDAISISWQSAVYGDTIRAIEPFSCRKPGKFFCAPDLEPLIDASNANLDPAGRERQLQQIMARLHDEAPTIFLVNLTTVIAFSPRVKDIVATRSGFRFERMTLTP